MLASAQLSQAPATPAVPARCWLIDGDGARIRITGSGVVLGRGPGSDVVVADARLAAAHALVRYGPYGPELLAVSGGHVEVNGAPVAGAARLRDGDLLNVAGTVFAVAVAAGHTPPEMSWVLRTDCGTRCRIARQPFVVGGGRDDDLVLHGWPAGALVFVVHPDGLTVQASTDADLSGLRLARGEPVAVTSGDVVDVAGSKLTLLGAAPLVDVDTAAQASARSTRFEFLPRGGRLTVALGHTSVELRLPELRASLVAVLLSPPGEYEAGEYVPDELVLPAVWPGRPDKSRADLNTLIMRLRRDLEAAGLQGHDLIQRAPWGRSTRFALAEGAEVSVR